jgi:hypothetical protein
MCSPYKEIVVVVNGEQLCMRSLQETSRHFVQQLSQQQKQVSAT